MYFPFINQAKLFFVQHGYLFISEVKLSLLHFLNCYIFNFHSFQSVLVSLDSQESSNSPASSLEPPETISLTLTDSQLESFSVTNFTYDQLAQLAKIGLLALNNAAKDTTPMTTQEGEKKELVVSPETSNTDNAVVTDESSTILLVTSDNLEEKAKIQILTGSSSSDTLVISTSDS